MFVCECVYFHVHIPGWQGTVWKPSLPATVPLGGKSADQSFGNTTTPTPSSGCKTCTDTHRYTHAHKLFSLWHYLTSVQQGVGLQLTTFLHVCRGLGWMALLIISKQQLSHQKTHCFSQIDVSHAGLWSQTPCPSTQKCVFFFFFLVSFVYRTIYVSLTPEACIQFSSAWTLAPMSMFWNIAIILEPLVIQGAT